MLNVFVKKILVLGFVFSLPVFGNSKNSERQNPCPSHLYEVLKARLDPLGFFLRSPKRAEKRKMPLSNPLDFMEAWGNPWQDQRLLFLNGIHVGIDLRAQKSFFKTENRWGFFERLKIGEDKNISEIIFEKRDWILREIKGAKGHEPLKSAIENFQIENYADWIEFASLYVLFVDTVKNPSAKFVESLEKNKASLRDQLKEGFNGTGFIPWFDVSRISQVGKLPLGPRYPTLLQINQARVELLTPIRSFHLPPVGPRETEPLFFQNPLIREKFPNFHPFEYLTDSLGFFIRDLHVYSPENFGSTGDHVAFFGHQKLLWEKLMALKFQLGDPPLARGLLDLAMAKVSMGYQRLPLLGDPVHASKGPGLSLDFVVRSHPHLDFQRRIENWLFEQMKITFDTGLLDEEIEFMFSSFYSDAEQINALRRAAHIVSKIYLDSFGSQN